MTHVIVIASILIGIILGVAIMSRVTKNKFLIGLGTLFIMNAFCAVVYNMMYIYR